MNLCTGRLNRMKCNPSFLSFKIILFRTISSPLYAKDIWFYSEANLWWHFWNKWSNLTCAGQSSQFDDLSTKKRPRDFLSYSSVCPDSRRQQFEWIMCIWNYTTFSCAHDHRQLPASRVNSLCDNVISYYSGFTFSHYDLPFPTRYCIPYVRSGLYQLVIRQGISCVRAWPRFALFGFVHRRGHHAFRESRVVYR